MLNKRTTDVLRWLAVLCGLVALWSIAGPAQIGGPVSIAVTRGVSMEPVFSSGDLVLVRETNRVSTGDIVLYRSEQTGQDVLHRVIAVSGDQYVVKGDNNGWVDEDRPTLADITGVYWGHVPNAGEWLSKLKSPVASAAFGGVFLVLFGISLPPARAQDARRPALHRGELRFTRRIGTQSAAFAQSLTADALMGVLLGALVLGVGLGAWAFLQRATEPGFVTLPYAHSVDWTYTGRAVAFGANGADGSGIIASPDTGQPIFPAITPVTSHVMDYRLNANGIHDVTGRARMFVVMREDVTGWSQQFEIAPWTDFEGTEVTISADVDVASAVQAFSMFEQATTLSGALYRAVLAAEVEVWGTDESGHEFSDTYRPFLVFRVELPRLIRVEQAVGTTAEQLAAGIDPLSEVFHPMVTREVVRAIEVDRSVGVLTQEVTVKALRLVAAVLIPLSLAGAIVLNRLRAWADRRGLWFLIRARHGSRLAFAAAPPVDAYGRGYIEITHFDDLLAIA